VLRIDEGGGAERAGVGSAAGVLGIGVAVQQASPREAFPAVGAGVTLLTGMDKITEDKIKIHKEREIIKQCSR